MSKKTQLKSKIPTPIVSFGHKFLPGKPAFDAKYPLIIGLVLASIAAFAFVHAAAVTTTEETVVLTNGQSVRLGEPIAELASSLKTDLHTVNANFYQYPADPKKPVEALIYAQNQQVVAIEVIGGNDVHASSGVRLGLDRTFLQARLSQRLRQLDSSLSLARYSGLAIDQANSEAYFLMPPCSGSTKIINYTLVQKTYAPILESRSIPIDCTNQRN